MKSAKQRFWSIIHDQIQIYLSTLSSKKKQICNYYDCDNKKRAKNITILTFFRDEKKF